MDYDMRWLLALFTSLAVGLVLLADLGAMRPYLAVVHATPYGDKVLHVGIAGALALVLNATLVVHSPAPWRAMLSGTLLAAAILTVEEATNVFTPHRACSLGDLAANYTGVLLLGLAPLAGLAAIQRGFSLASPGAHASGSADA